MDNLQIDDELTYTDPITLKSYNATLVKMVDELLYKVRKKGIWEITDFCIQIWAKKYPKEHKRYIDAVREIKRSRGKETGATKANQLRYIAEPPHDVMYLLEKIAYHKLEDYGREKFWRDFARKYPGFAVAEKI